VIEDASAVAAKTPGANHRTPEGRRALLAARYKLAWGDPRTRVNADAFLTGLVHVSKDLKTYGFGLVEGGFVHFGGDGVGGHQLRRECREEKEAGGVRSTKANEGEREAGSAEKGSHDWEAPVPTR
jgi:hypothetical protein